MVEENPVIAAMKKQHNKTTSTFGHKMNTIRVHYEFFLKGTVPFHLITYARNTFR